MTRNSDALSCVTMRFLSRWMCDALQCTQVSHSLYSRHETTPPRRRHAAACGGMRHSHAGLGSCTGIQLATKQASKDQTMRPQLDLCIMLQIESRRVRAGLVTYPGACIYGSFTYPPLDRSIWGGFRSNQKRHRLHIGRFMHNLHLLLLLNPRICGM